MPVITDVLLTVFATQGVAGTLNAFNRMQAANERLVLAQQNMARVAGNPSASYIQYLTAWHRLNQANREVLAATMEELRVGALTSAAAVGALVKAGEKAVEVYSQFGMEVMNIRDLTGDTLHNSARMASLMRVSGMTDMMEVRELLRVGAASFSGKGQQALGLLGIPANVNESGLTLLNQIIDRLNGMQDGILKTQIMEDLFGKRGVAAMLPLLRMTKEQRDAAMELADSFSEADAKAIQSFQVSSALLGQTILQKVVFPIASKLLPMLEGLIMVVTRIVNLFAFLDNILGGIPTWVVAFGGMAVAIYNILRIVILAAKAFQLLNVRMAINAFIQGIIARNPAMIAAGVVALGLAGYGAYATFSNGDDSKSRDSATDKFGRAVDNFSGAIARMADEFGNLKGKNVPGGLGQLDIQALARQRAMGAIG